MNDDFVRVLFVCMGNICRSPSGEGVFRKFVDDANHARKIEIDSAGTIGYHIGSPADSRMRLAARRRGFDLNSTARQVSVRDIAECDLIIAMDSDNLSALETMAGGARGNIRMLGAYLPGVRGNTDAPSVPDPYYGGDDGFESVLDMIECACPAMLAHCLELFAAKGR